MTVLKGEGKVPILFNSASISVGSRTNSAYLARPDLSGEWPTIIVVPSAWGLTGAMKYLTRRLARQGFATICPDLYSGSAPARSAPKEAAVEAALHLPRAGVKRDLEQIVRFITNPTGFWSSAEDGFGVVGFGVGGIGATDIAVSHPGSPLALVAAAVRPGTVAGADGGEESTGPDLEASLSDVIGPLLGIYGRDDVWVSMDDITAARRVAPHGEWVLHEGVGADFFDDGNTGFDLAAQSDTVDRLSEFFSKHLPGTR